jgi:hypothetical protein
MNLTKIKEAIRKIEQENKERETSILTKKVFKELKIGNLI